MCPFYTEGHVETAPPRIREKLADVSEERTTFILWVEEYVSNKIQLLVQQYNFCSSLFDPKTEAVPNYTAQQPLR
jgi:hypothetical protein